jgi:hypothetical protein
VSLSWRIAAWEGSGNTFNIAAFTTYWLVNKSSLPLSFRRMVPTLAGIAGGRLRGEAAVNDAATDGGTSGVPGGAATSAWGSALGVGLGGSGRQNDDDDTFALLESAATAAVGMGGGSSSPMQPPPGLAAEPFCYDPLEVTSGPLMISFTRPHWECMWCAPPLWRAA